MQELSSELISMREDAENAQKLSYSKIWHKFLMGRRENLVSLLPLSLCKKKTNQILLLSFVDIFIYSRLFDRNLYN